MNQDKVDVVIPFVNCNDTNWMQDYTQTLKCFSIPKERFRSWNTLKYWFRGIAKYAPYVNNIVLILARESQIPDWLDTSKVRIVYHRDFMPQQCLPTFSSSAIESFLYNIEGLSEKFIYFNDNMFLINPTTLEDFFLNGVPRMQFIFRDKYNHHSIFRVQCRNSLDMITDALHLERYPKEKLFLSNHSVATLLKSTLDSVKELCEDKILRTVTPTRSPCNVHKHIYEYYQFYTDNYTSDYSLQFSYLEMSDNLDEMKRMVLDENLQLICLNDSDKIKDYKKTRAELLRIFELKFPDKCKYEI